MDKSESEILEEWTLVSSVYDTEQGSDVNEKKINANRDVQASINNSTEISTNSNSEINTEAINDSRTESRIELSYPDREKTITVASVSLDAKKTDDGDTDSIKAVKTDIEVTAESNTEDAVEANSDEMHDLNIKETIQADIEETTEGDSEEGAEADTEETYEPDTEEITVIETIMYDVKKISDIDTEKAIETSVEKVSYADIEEVKSENEKTDTVDIKADNGNEIKECLDSDFDNNTVTTTSIETGIEHKMDHNSEDHSGDQILNSSLDSSMEHIQIEHYDGSSMQNVPQLISNLTEQESAAVESSSSDIDIIDENMEESITSSYLHPLSLSIQGSVDKSGVLTSPSKEGKDVKIENFKQLEKFDLCAGMSETHPKFSEVYSEKLEPKILETFPKRSDYEYQRQSSEERKENVHRCESRGPRPNFNIISMILQFLRNMSCFEWSLIGGIVVGLYLTVVFNQINILAVVEKDNVVSQMKKMIDELKYDNKILKDQMLSEMKNDKMFSSFEYQIKELRKENSRLNHMLYDVAKVLEKQKDSHERYEKKEAENLAPFKKEINKLKEHINILKFDNEELQKQLVRMRYASYSQGGTDASKEKGNEQKEETKADMPSSTDEIPLDINSLKKWNELISLLSKELRILQENDPLANEKYHSEAKQNINWYWKAFLKGFKGTFEEFKANITSKFSDYKKVHENTLSDIYKSVKKFFTVEEQNNHFTSSHEKDSQWKNIGDFFSDLKDKWTKIKSRIDTSDLKSFFKDFKMPGDSDTSQEYNSQKTSEYNKGKPTNVHFESERKPTNVHLESERKPTNVHFESAKQQDKVKSDSEDSEWMFERAALRAELRDAETEEDVNWFLKKNKHSSRDKEKK